MESVKKVTVAAADREGTAENRRWQWRRREQWREREVAAEREERKKTAAERKVLAEKDFSSPTVDSPGVAKEARLGR